MIYNNNIINWKSVTINLQAMLRCIALLGPALVLTVATPPCIWSVFRNMFYLDDSSSRSQGVSIGRFPLARMLLVHKRITETEPIRRKRISIVVGRIGSAMKLMWHPAIREGSRCGEVRLLIASFNMRPWLS